MLNDRRVIDLVRQADPVSDVNDLPAPRLDAAELLVRREPAEENLIKVDVESLKRGTESLTTGRTGRRLLPYTVAAATAAAIVVVIAIALSGGGEGSLRVDVVDGPADPVAPEGPAVVPDPAEDAKSASDPTPTVEQEFHVDVVPTTPPHVDSGFNSARVGTWIGEWSNDTLGTLGSLEATMSIGPNGQKLIVAVDIGGQAFGIEEPLGFVIELDMGAADRFVQPYRVEILPLGALELQVHACGRDHGFSAAITSMPFAGVASIELAGEFGYEYFEGAYTIQLDDGDPVLGRFRAVKGADPAPIGDRTITGPNEGC